MTLWFLLTSVFSWLDSMRWIPPKVQYFIKRGSKDIHKRTQVPSSLPMKSHTSTSTNTTIDTIKRYVSKVQYFIGRSAEDMHKRSNTSTRISPEKPSIDTNIKSNMSTRISP